MPGVGLPTGAVRTPKGPDLKRGRGFDNRGRSQNSLMNSQIVAHDINGTKERTEDVVNLENREKTFEDLLISQPVLKGLKNAGFLRPSPVQLMAIPPAKIGFDLVVQSKSGTGKTCVYVVSALEMLNSELQSLQALVLAPTREIAIQGVTVAMQIGQELKDVKMAAFIGGISLAEDKVKARTCHLAVGTPGRVKQLITEGILTVDSVRLVVLDEADKLLEPSFLGETTAILNMLPKSKQVIALSATYPEQLAVIAERFMRSPQHIRPGKASQVLAGVAQFVLEVEHSPAAARQNAIKQAALLNILSSVSYTQCLVFSNYSTIAQSTADFLNSRGFPAIFISAGQDQTRRLAAIQTFKQFNCRILCSTDLTARGIDAENVNLVINLEVPWEQNTYLHRIGRGGRFGSHSLAVTLASKGAEMGKLKSLVLKTGSTVRILPSEIPKDVRGQMEQMEIMDTSVTLSDVSDESRTTLVDKNDSASKYNNEEPSGKIKRRGKRTANGESKDDIELNKNLKDFEPVSDRVSDEDLVKNFVLEQNNKHNTSEPMISYEKLREISTKLLNNEKVEVVHSDHKSYDPEKIKSVGEAIQRISQKRRDEFDTRLDQVERMYKDKDVSQLLEELQLKDSREEKKEEVSESVVNNIDSEKESTLNSSDDSSDSSDSDSDSSSSSSESESETESEPETPMYYQNPYNTFYPNASSGVPHPQLPGFPSAQEWYIQWCAAVAHQRMEIQQMEYNRYLQYLYDTKKKD